MKILIHFILLISLISCNQNEETKNDNPLLEKKSKYIPIKNFLFFKKGLTLNQVIDSLDSKSIKHSKILNVNNFNKEILKNGSILGEFNDEKCIEVYDYPLGDLKLSTFRLFFLNDILLSLKLEKSIDINGNITDEKLKKFEDKHFELRIFGNIYYTIKNKYGNPTFDIGYESDIYLDLFNSITSENLVLNKHRELKENHVIYRLFFNPYFIEDLELIKSDYISILMRGDLNSWVEEKYISESHIINVSFKNSYLNDIITQKRIKSELPEVEKEKKRIKSELEFKKNF